MRVDNNIRRRGVSDYIIIPCTFQAPSARVAFVPGAHRRASERAREVQVRETEAVGKEAGPLSPRSGCGEWTG